MLSKPKFITPNLNSDVRVVDVNDLTVSNGTFPLTFIVDGNEGVNGALVVLSDLDDGGYHQSDNNEDAGDYICQVHKNWVHNSKKIWNSSTALDSNFTAEGWFYPTNEYGDNNLFSARVGVFVNGARKIYNRVEPYKLKIYLQHWATEMINGSTTYSIKTQVESQDILFYCNKKPNINITYKNGDNYSSLDDDISLGSRMIEFKGTYLQEQNVPLKKYGWRITDNQTGIVLHDTISKSQIYGTKDNMICRYNGFVSGCEYKIEFFVETQNGDTRLIEKTFNVIYDVNFLTNDFKINALRNEPGIKLDWSESVAIMGSKSNGVFYKDSFPIVGKSTSVVIPRGDVVVFDRGTVSNLDISEQSYMVLSMQIKTLPEIKSYTLFYTEGYSNSGNKISRKLTCDFDQMDENRVVVSYLIQNEDGIIHSTDYALQNPPGDYVWYIIKLYPFSKGDSSAKIEVSEFVAEGGIIPSNNLYPKESLCPSFGEWIQRVKNNEIVNNVSEEIVDEGEG